MTALIRPKSARTVKPPSYKYDAIPSTLTSNAQPDSNSKPQRRPRKDSRQQNSYHPDKEMTKEELSEWRAAERKKRNRLAAAASRNKLRQKEGTGGQPSQPARRPRRSAKHQRHQVSLATPFFDKYRTLLDNHFLLNLNLDKPRAAQQQRPKARYTDSPYSTVTLSSDDGSASSSGYLSSSSLDTLVPSVPDPLYEHPSGPQAGPSPYPDYPGRVVHYRPAYYSYQAGMPHQSPYVAVVDSSFAFSSGGLHDKNSFNAHQARHNSACSNGFITRDAPTVVI